jgi:HSP20 family molecular chaperone IbpA
MVQPFLRQWNRPALPPPRLTAGVYTTAGGEAYALEVPLPGLRPGEITIEATPVGVKVTTQGREDQQDDGRQYLQREQPIQPLSRLFASRQRVIKVDPAA